MMKVISLIFVIGLWFYAEQLFGSVPTLIEGSICRVSALPAAKTASYPDCNFAVELAVFNTLSGPAVPRRINLVLPGFRDRKDIFPYPLQPGHKIQCRIVPAAEVDPQEAVIQTVDGLELFELESYYAREAKIIYSYQELSGPVVYKDGIIYESLWEKSYNPSGDKESAAAQKGQISQDLEELLNQWDFNPETGKNARAGFSPAASVKKFSDKEHFSAQGLIWFRKGKGIFNIPESYKLPAVKLMPEDRLQRLMDFKSMLDVQNIQLLVLIIPSHHEISARVLAPELAGIPDNSVHIARQLLENQIEAVSLSRQILEQAKEHEMMFFYLKNDHHPAQGATQIAAQVLASRMKRFHFPDTWKKASLTRTQVPNFYKLTYPAIPWTSEKANRMIMADEILQDGKPIVFPEESPVLLMGNSFTQTPGMFSLPSYLAWESRIVPSYLRQSGVGLFVTLFNRILWEPEKYLHGKRLCILVAKDEMLIDYPMADIRRQDKAMQLLSRKQNVGIGQCRSASEKSGAGADSLPDNLAQGRAFFVLPQLRHQFTELEITVPPEVNRSQEAIVQLEYYADRDALFFGYHQAEWTEHAFEVKFRRILFKITPEELKNSDRLRIQATTYFEKMNLFLLRNVTFYQ